MTLNVDELEILSIKENDYVAAARVIGDSNFKIVFKHVLPNVLPSIIVRATLGISTAILDAAALGFGLVRLWLVELPDCLTTFYEVPAGACGAWAGPPCRRSSPSSVPVCCAWRS